MNPQIISQPQANQKKESGKIISQIPRQNLQKIKSLVPESNTGLSSRSVYEETCRTLNKKEDHVHSERMNKSSSNEDITVSQSDNLSRQSKYFHSKPHEDQKQKSSINHINESLDKNYISAVLPLNSINFTNTNINSKLKPPIQ